MADDNNNTMINDNDNTMINDNDNTKKNDNDSAITPPKSSVHIDSKPETEVVDRP